MYVWVLFISNFHQDQQSVQLKKKKEIMKWNMAQNTINDLQNNGGIIIIAIFKLTKKR